MWGEGSLFIVEPVSSVSVELYNICMAERLYINISAMPTFGDTSIWRVGEVWIYGLQWQFPMHCGIVFMCSMRVNTDCARLTAKIDYVESIMLETTQTKLQIWDKQRFVGWAECLRIGSNSMPNVICRFPKSLFRAEFQNQMEPVSAWRSH